MSDCTKLAFVIMPFESSLDAVYRDLIRATLEEAGFTVERADDLVTSRNILDDIVAKLAEADFVVADLTDLNPNVFYELGVAHSLNGKVLMLTQDVSSLPFDLQSYRVLEYDTHFARFTDARQRLAEFAAAAFAGSLPFGSPVSDFARTRTAQVGTTAALVGSVPDSLDDGEPEQLDHLVNLFDSGEKLNQAVTEIGAATERIGAQVTAATSELEEANTIDDPIAHARATHAIVRQIGLRMNEYARFLDDLNGRYEDALNTLETSLEGALTSHPVDDEASREDLREQVATLATWEQSIMESRGSTAEFAATILAAPRIEKYSSKAMTQAYSQLQRLVANLDKTSSALGRVQRIASRILDDEAIGSRSDDGLQDS